MEVRECGEIVEHQSEQDQARREDELAQFFANRPEVADHGSVAGVRATKILLPLVAFGLLAVVIGWPFLSKQESSVTLSYRELEKSGDEIRMSEPHYLGTDNKDRHFEIAATEAVQQGVNAKEVNLDNVRASMRLESGDNVDATATLGVYLPEEERLELRDGIRLQAGGGYSFEGDHLTLDINQGQVKGGGGVAGEAPFGSFEAEDFSIDVSGRSMALEGKVRVRLDPGYQTTSNGPAAPAPAAVTGGDE